MVLLKPSIAHVIVCSVVSLSVIFFPSSLFVCEVKCSNNCSN